MAKSHTINGKPAPLEISSQFYYMQLEVIKFALIMCDFLGLLFKHAIMEMRNETGLTGIKREG